MINYIEKGYGLFDYLNQHGAYLDQLDGEWRLTGNLTVDQVNELIEQYNPWPYKKAEKLAQINRGFAAAVDQLVAGSTSDERNSWAIQEREAVEFFKDDLTPCPALTVLATARGIPLDLLAQKVLEKAALYKQYYFTFQGMRDKAEDMLKALPNEGEYHRLGELDSIYFGV